MVVHSKVVNEASLADASKLAGAFKHPPNGKVEALGKLGHEVAAFLIEHREQFDDVHVQSWCGSLPMRLACALATGAVQLRTSKSSTSASPPHSKSTGTIPLGTSLAS